MRLRDLHLHIHPYVQPRIGPDVVHDIPIQQGALLVASQHLLDDNE